MGRTPKPIQEDDYETEQKKQAAADVLFHYSQFAMVCIGEGVKPTDLRLHLMKKSVTTRGGNGGRETGPNSCLELSIISDSISDQEISGMPTSLKKESIPAVASPNSTGEPSSSGAMKIDKSESS